MKRILLTALILTASTLLSWTLPPLYAEESYSIRSGLNFIPGLFYNRNWDPGYNGTAASLSVERKSDSFLLSAGAEAGYSYTGFNMLFPVKAGLIIYDDNNLRFSTSAAVMPGLILSRPTPYFLFAAEISAGLSWIIDDSFSLRVSAGPRYTTSPQYSAAVAPLEMIDLIIGLGAGFKL